MYKLFRHRSPRRRPRSSGSRRRQGNDWTPRSGSDCVPADRGHDPRPRLRRLRPTVLGSRPEDRPEVKAIPFWRLQRINDPNEDRP